MNNEELFLYTLTAIWVANLLWYIPMPIDLVLLAPIMAILIPTLISYGDTRCT